MEALDLPIRGLTQIQIIALFGSLMAMKRNLLLQRARSITNCLNILHNKGRRLEEQGALCIVRNAGLLKIFWLGLPVQNQNKTLQNSVYRKGTCLAEQEGVDFTLLILILSSIRHDG